MKIIKTTSELAEVCEKFAHFSYTTVDTEFLRESTFWPELCLVQIASPDEAVIVDVLADGIDLAPFFTLMNDTSVVKVFHAARQDIEIIFKLGALIPDPVFDTQVAAMVCGYGDSISYDQLVQRITGTQIDKTSRFTDWSQRPLSQKQLDYALADVTHLRQVYQALKANLEEQDRTHWVKEEMKILTARETYDVPVEDAWRRLKMRVRKPIDLAVLQSVATWREKEARGRDMPRGRIMKDDAVYEIAQQHPRNSADLARLRAVPRGFERSRHAETLLDAVNEALQIPRDELPKIPRPTRHPEGVSAAVEMLKVLLKLTAEKHGVAAKVLATVDDLEKIVSSDEADVPALKGWRRELFGVRALDLKNGKIALGYDGKRICVVDVNIQ